MIDTLHLFTKHFKLLAINRFSHKEGGLTFSDEGLTFVIKRFSNNSKGTLYIKCPSLPKALFGNNLAEVRDGDFHEIVDRIQRIASAAGLQLHVKAEELQVSRVDFCMNITLQDDMTVEDCIMSLDRYSLSRCKRKRYPEGGHESIYYKSRQNQLTFYNKIRNLKKDGDIGNVPENVLRIERRLLNAASVKRGLHIKCPLLIDVYSEALARRIILSSVGRLHHTSATPDSSSVAKRKYHRKDEMPLSEIEDRLIACNYDWKQFRNSLIAEAYCQRRQSYRVMRKLQKRFEESDTKGKNLFSFIEAHIDSHQFLSVHPSGYQQLERSSLTSPSSTSVRRLSPAGAVCRRGGEAKRR